MKFKEFVKASSYGQREEMSFIFSLGKDELNVNHNYSGYWSYGKKYTTIEGYVGKGRFNDRVRYDIDLFVSVPKSELDKTKGAW